MARIRTIKPEIRRSLTVCSWPYVVRWTFAGLPGYCDDEGRGIDNTNLVKSELYPLDEDMTAKKIDKHLDTIAASGPLCRYEVAGQRYLHLLNFGEHQRVNRPTPSRLPPCPIHDNEVSTHVALTDPSLPRARACAPAEQGREGKGKEGSSEQGSAHSAQPHDSGPEHDLLDKHQADLGPLPAITVRYLTGHVANALNEGATPEQIHAALDTWRRRPGAKPGLLPHLIADQRAAIDPHTPSAEVEAWIAEQTAKRTAGATR